MGHNLFMFNQLRVVELASVLAGPAVGMFFAELGAKVIKVENPHCGGDVTRSWKLPTEDPNPDVWSAYYSSVNWHKETIFADFTNLQQRQQLYELLKTTDIVITNFKHGDDLKFGMDYATLCQMNNKLIYGQITAFGPQSDRVGFDVVLQAESGFMYMTGYEGFAPVKMPVALIDLLAAHQLKEGILCALLQRGQSGKGSLVSVSLLDAALASLANQATNWLMAEHVPMPMGSLHPNIAPYGEVFTTADGLGIVLAVGNNKQFEALCQTLNLPHLPHDARFNNNQNRVKNRKNLQQLLAEAFKVFDNRHELLQLFIQNGVPAGAIRSMPQVFELPETNHLILEQITPNGQLTKRLKSTVFTITPYQ